MSDTPAKPFAWLEESLTDWRALPPGSTARCRYAAPTRGYRCPNVAVAELRRGRKQVRWWAYCADHLYGRRVEGGKVLLAVRSDCSAALDAILGKG